MWNKNRLVKSFLIPTMEKFMWRKPKIFSDLFLWTGSVAIWIKQEYQCKIIWSDLQLYSVIINKHLIENIKELKFSKLKKHLPKTNDKVDIHLRVCKFLNDLEGTEWYIFENFCPGWKFNRQYFTDNNWKRADSIRLKINEWEKLKLITKKERNYLLACLIESIDKVANTTSVYWAYLKNIKNAANKDMVYSDIWIFTNHNDNKIYQKDANLVAKDKSIKHDVVYLDPPYNSRQYASNYHVLETIAEYDTSVELKWKTGMRNYDDQKSKYSRKWEAYKALEELVTNIDANYIFISYNSDWLLKKEQIKEILSKRWEYKFEPYKYRRYKADKTENRNHNETDLFEHLHCLKITK